MRLSTSLMYSNGLKGIMSNESELNRLTEQIGSGRRVLTPADDPLAAALAINVAQTKQMNETFASNRNTAKQNLGQEANILGSLTTAMQDVMTRVVQAGNATMDDSNRGALSTALKSARDSILNLANSTNGNGQYLFSGYAGSAAPYDSNGVYSGATGDRLVQVDQTRKLSTSDLGSDIFNRANPGSQTYITTANPGNSGTAEFTSVSVRAGGTNVGSDFSIDFTESGGVMSYTVTTTPPAGSPTPPSTIGPIEYVPGASIDMGGVSLAIKGVPAAGDKITVERASSANVDLFKTLDSLIAALDAPSAGDDKAIAKLNNTLSTVNKTLNNVYENLQTVQASVGARLNELDALDASGAQRGLTYAKSLSDLEDLDLIPAASALALRQVALQAAQAAFMAVQGSSLFSRK